MRVAAGTVTIETIIAYVLDDLGKSDMYGEWAETIGQKVIRGISDLNIFHVDNVQVAYLDVTDMNTAILPEDFVEYRKIGINVGGRIWTLTLNENIILPRGERCGKPFRDVINSGGLSGINYGYYFPDHYRGGQFIAGLYGIGGGFNRAYYRIDKETNQIIFDGAIPQCEVILEYQSNGIKSNGGTLIPRNMVEVLVAWTHWKLIDHRSDVSLGEKQSKKLTYMEELEKFSFQENALTADELRDIIYQSFYLAPKR